MFAFVLEHNSDGAWKRRQIQTWGLIQQYYSLDKQYTVTTFSNVHLRVLVLLFAIAYQRMP